jgi:hypothetical protein
LPIGSTTKSHNDFLLSETESAADKLITLVPVHLIGSIGQPLPLLLGDNFINGNETFFSFDVPLANTDVLAIVGNRNVSDCLSALSAWQEVLILLVDLVNDYVVTSNVDQLLIILQKQTVLDLSINTEEMPKQRMGVSILV